MKKKGKLAIFFRRFIPIIILTTVVGVVCFFIGKKIGLNTDTSKTNTSIEDVKVEKQTISKTLTASGSIESSSSEKLELNTSYYYDSIYVEEDDIVKKALELGIPLELAYSCYAGGDKNCGECESCKYLKKALEENKAFEYIERLF